MKTQMNFKVGDKFLVNVYVGNVAVGKSKFYGTTYNKPIFENVVDGIITKVTEKAVCVTHPRYFKESVYEKWNSWFPKSKVYPTKMENVYKVPRWLLTNPKNNLLYNSKKVYESAENNTD